MQIPNGWNPLAGLQNALNQANIGSTASINPTTLTLQSLPGGQVPPISAGPIAPPKTNPSDQFGSSALAFLTALQTQSAGAASADSTVTSGGTATPAITVSQGLADVTSALNELKQALDTAEASAATTSGGSTSSSGSTSTASSTTLSTSAASSLVQALEQLNATLQSISNASSSGAGGEGHHHHHHHHGGGGGELAASANTSTSSGSSTSGGSGGSTTVTGGGSATITTSATTTTS